MTQKLTVENLVDFAIIEGFTSGKQSFLELMEEQLQSDILLTEVGGAEAALQAMIDSTLEKEETIEVVNEVASLQEKMIKVLK